MTPQDDARMKAWQNMQALNKLYADDPDQSAYVGGDFFWEHKAIIEQLLQPAPAGGDEPVAWAREWEGDDSDLGNMIVEFNREDLDDNPNWFALYARPISTLSSPPAVVNNIPPHTIHNDSCDRQTSDKPGGGE